MEIKNFQEFIIALCNYWVDHGCLWSQSYDAQMGAGTFHPHTFLKGIGPEPWRCVYVQPCRRPVDGRYGKSPYRFQHYYQLQVLLKPAPSNIIDVFLKSLEHVGINLEQNDIGLLEDDWKGPTLGAWGLGWEVRANGQEVTQFTYFQQLGGLDLDVVSGEITYGLERLFMYAKGYKNALDMPYNEHFTWGDIFYQNEHEFSFFNFKEANINDLFSHFEKCEQYVFDLCGKGLVLPAYDYVLQASHTFNLLDSRGAISATERQRFIGKVRHCAKICASQYQKEREKLNHPMLNKISTDARAPIISKNNKKIFKNYDELILEDKKIYVEDNNKVTNNNVTILFELGVEEIPPLFQKLIFDELNKTIKNNFTKEFLAENFISKFEVFVSSRRIGIMFKEIPEKISREAPNKLPERIAKDASGNFSQAAQGFAKKNGIDLKEMKFNNGFLCYEEILETPLFLAKKFDDWCQYLASITPLKMKWLPDDIAKPFIRPVRWIVALADDKVIPIEMFGLKSGRYTCGQRILSPNFIPIDHAKKYHDVLKENHVIVNQNERRQIILDNIQKYEKEINGKILEDANLFTKCIYFSENPYVFLAPFDKKYLRLPRDLITSVLKEHMNYFSVLDHENNLLPYYIGVGNYKCKNVDDMIAGTQNVVSGRLDDGAFYYDTDLNTPLFDLNQKLESQVFQENMGTIFDKQVRLKEFCSKILNTLPLHKTDVLNATILQAAAEFCKSDLKTGCVQEFPDEMQGIMGGILFEHQNILNNTENSHAAATAISEHYFPKNIDSPLPNTDYGLILSLADKIDSLCMMINHGVKVEGNKDPLGMRRLAISILRLLGLKHGEKSNLAFPSFNDIVNCWAESVQNCSQVKINNNFRADLQQFMFERIKSFLKEDFESVSGIKLDIRSIEALEKQFFNKPILKAKEFVIEINERLKQTEENSLRAALIPYHRAKNLTQNIAATEVDPSKFTTVFEKNIYETLVSTEEEAHSYLEKDDFKSYLNALQRLTKPLAELFDNVMINDPDSKLKQNRLSILCNICRLYEEVANFSLIQVQ